MKARRNQKREILSDVAMGAFHCDKSCTPPPPVCFMGQKCGNTGWPCWDQPVLPRVTYREML